MSRREDEAVEVMVAAKDAYRNDRTEENKAARDEAVRAVIDIRNEERADRVGITTAGDVLTNGQEG